SMSLPHLPQLLEESEKIIQIPMSGLSLPGLLCSSRVTTSAPPGYSCSCGEIRALPSSPSIQSRDSSLSGGTPVTAPCLLPPRNPQLSTLSLPKPPTADGLISTSVRESTTTS